MTDTTRRQLHVLLDRAIDADPKKMPAFRFDFFALGAEAAVFVENINGVGVFKERCVLSAFPAAVTHALEATAS